MYAIGSARVLEFEESLALLGASSELRPLASPWFPFLRCGSWKRLCIVEVRKEAIYQVIFPAHMHRAAIAETVLCMSS